MPCKWAEGIALVACPPVAPASAHWWTSHQDHPQSLFTVLEPCAHFPTFVCAIQAITALAFTQGVSTGSSTPGFSAMFRISSFIAPERALIVSRRHRPSIAVPSPGSSSLRLSESWLSCLLAMLVATSGLFSTRVGPTISLRQAAAAQRECPAPVPEDTDPAESATPERECEAGEIDCILLRRPCGFLSLRTPPALQSWTPLPPLVRRPSRHADRSGHFLAVGRILRDWLQSPLC